MEGSDFYQNISCMKRVFAEIVCLSTTYKHINPLRISTLQNAYLI